MRCIYQVKFCIFITICRYINVDFGIDFFIYKIKGGEQINFIGIIFFQAMHMRKIYIALSKKSASSSSLKNLKI